MECSSIPVRLHNWFYYSCSVSQISFTETRIQIFVFCIQWFQFLQAHRTISLLPCTFKHLYPTFICFLLFLCIFRIWFSFLLFFFLNYRSRVIPISIHRLFCPKCNPNAIHRLDKIYDKWGMNRKRVSEIWLLFKKVKNGWKSKVPAWNHWCIMFISGFISFHCYL